MALPLTHKLEREEPDEPRAHFLATLMSSTIIQADVLHLDQ